MSEKKDLRSYRFEELAAVTEDLGEKPFRAKQIFEWLHEKKADDFSAMTNLSKDLRKKLSENYEIYTVRPVRVLTSAIDGTRKYVHALHDGNVIETVLLKYDYGNALCISSQVGCRMGCRFCASTVDGLVRNLTAGEMAGQIYSVEADINERIGHVVVMGSGEPMDNFDAFTGFVDIITDDRGNNLSGRAITVSTCGLVPKIRELADRRYAITLALSLHAVTDEKRKEIMPVANKYPLEEVLEACRYYRDVTGRRITLEYSLIEGFNDSDEDVRGLTAIARKLGGHVNLIPVNPIRESKYRATAHGCAVRLKNKLEKNNINVTIRREMGRDISASCGQLRRSYINECGGGDRDA
ncbi:MAG: 23S rRNA (adenine(2503)-C(2))-methyltransferase RlmN [Lachnospiraceae bacterium]|nr:23S rRNA (adenine(2503)-C(2))-methyltransferase RlmN [Lachnospiraceae bacterium]